MTDKTEKLNSALDLTRKAMRELDDAASILIQDGKLHSDEYDMMDDIYITFLKVDNRLRKLGAIAAGCEKRDSY